MFEYTPLPDTIRYDLPGWPGFYVLIVPGLNPKNPDGADFLLCHQNFGIVHWMFGTKTETPEKLAELAHWNAECYLPAFVKDCCTEDETE
jgi:hypothetical protein